MRYLLLAFFLLLPSSAQALWLDSNWDYRVPIEIAPGKVGSSTAITNFPVYLNLDDLPGDFWTNVQADGDDIRLVEADEVTETAFELVAINSGGTAGELHFMADNLSTTSTSTFYLYYGNPAASAYAVTDTYGRNNVWSGHRAVYHLEDLTQDSSGNAYALTNNNSVGTTTGTIGYAADFGSSNTNKNLTASQLGLAVGDERTFSVMVNISTAPASGEVYDIFGMGYDSTDVVYVFEYRNVSGTYGLRVGRARYYVDDPTMLYTTTLTTGTWYHLAYTINSSRVQVLYLNGVAVASTTAVAGNGSGPTFDGAAFSRAYYAVARVLKGKVDETRVTAGVKPPAWITTQYNNQSSPTTFYTIGAQETNGAPPSPTPSQSIIWFD